MPTSPYFEWGVLDAIEDIMTVRGVNGQDLDAMQTVDIAVDTGAAEVVAPSTFAPAYAIRASAGSGSGTKYRTTSGNLVAN